MLLELRLVEQRYQGGVGGARGWVGERRGPQVWGGAPDGAFPGWRAMPATGWPA